MTLAYALQTGDWVVLGAYVLLLLAAGWWFSRREAKDTAGYFLAGRSMPGWAVALSILATAQSAATFVGVPQKGFGVDFTYLLANVGTIVASIVVATLFLPAYYRLNIATPYQLLETRFGPGARRAASLWYLVGRMMANGARVFIGALPVAMAVFGKAEPDAWQIVLCVLIFMAFGAVFTLGGGVRAAIYSDVLQVAVYLGAAVVILILLLSKVPASPAQIAEAVVDPPAGVPAPAFFRLGIGDAKPWHEFSLLTGLTGLALLNTAFFAMDQDLTQRLLACRSSRAAAKSLLSSTVAVGLPVVTLFLLLGVLLNVYYTRPDVTGTGGAALPAKADAMVDFVFAHCPAGVGGLMLAGLLAAGPAGINSSLNSMASSFVTDIYRPLHPGRTERHYVLIGRVSTIAAGALMGAFAAVCVYWQRGSGKQLVDFALGVMTFAYAGLLGVFFCAMFTRRGTGRSAVAALIAGFLTVVLLQPFVWMPLLRQPGIDALRQQAPWAALASPWTLCIGTLVAFVVCASPSGRGGFRAPPGTTGRH